VRYVISVFAVLLALIATARAEGESRLRCYMSTGATSPSSPEVFSRYWNAGPNVGIGLGYQANNNIVLRGCLDYQRMTHNADKERADLNNGDEVGFDGGTATILSATAEFKVAMTPAETPLTPYLVFGAGCQRLSLTDLTSTYQGESQTNSVDPEWSALILMGAGCDVRLADGIALFLQGEYAVGYTKGDRTHYFPVKVGIAFK